MLAHCKLLMFLFVLAKLLPERHNLYGNSLDFKLKYMRKKMHLKDNIDGTCDIGIEKKSLKKIDPVGSTVRYEMMKLCTGSV